MVQPDIQGAPKTDFFMYCWH